MPWRAARAATAGQAISLPDEIRAHFDPKDPAMHTTAAIDSVLILSGSADLELDFGNEVAFRAGDCGVERRTRHAWRVTIEEPRSFSARS